MLPGRSRTSTTTRGTHRAAHWCRRAHALDVAYVSSHPCSSGETPASSTARRGRTVLRAPVHRALRRRRRRPPPRRELIICGGGCLAPWLATPAIQSGAPLAAAAEAAPDRPGGGINGRDTGCSGGWQKTESLAARNRRDMAWSSGGRLRNQPGGPDRQQHSHQRRRNEAATHLYLERIPGGDPSGGPNHDGAPCHDDVTKARRRGGAKEGVASDRLLRMGSSPVPRGEDRWLRPLLLVQRQRVAAVAVAEGR